MRTIICAAMLAPATTTAGAQAAELTSSTLACTSTVNDTLLNQVDKIRIGVILNFRKSQVISDAPGLEDTSIDKVTGTQISFSSSQAEPGGYQSTSSG